MWASEGAAAVGGRQLGAARQAGLGLALRHMLQPRAVPEPRGTPRAAAARHPRPALMWGRTNLGAEGSPHQLLQRLVHRGVCRAGAHGSVVVGAGADGGGHAGGRQARIRRLLLLLLLLRRAQRVERGALRGGARRHGGKGRQRAAHGGCLALSLCRGAQAAAVAMSRVQFPCSSRQAGQPQASEAGRGVVRPQRAAGAAPASAAAAAAAAASASGDTNGLQAGTRSSSRLQHEQGNRAGEQEGRAVRKGSRCSRSQRPQTWLGWRLSKHEPAPGVASHKRTCAQRSRSCACSCCRRCTAACDICGTAGAAGT